MMFYEFILNDLNIMISCEFVLLCFIFEYISINRKVKFIKSIA